MTRLITWPEPTNTEIALVEHGNRGRAIISYRNTARVTLANGLEVKPTLKTAAAALDAYALFGATMVVEDGGYVAA